MEYHDDQLDFPLRLSQLALLNIRDDNAFLSPLAIEEALVALRIVPTSSLTKERQTIFDPNFPLSFHNFILLNRDSSEVRSDLEGPNSTNALNRTDFRIHSFNDSEQPKTIFHDLLKQFAEETNVSLITSQKNIGQYLVDPMTLITCSSLRFRPNHREDWETLWSLKFHTNSHLSIETEFYFTKGFFRVAFHSTFQKIEIPGESIRGIPMTMVILLPRCSSDLVHLYANIDEYLHRPMSLAYVGVCIPQISIDSDINLNETLKSFYDSNNKELFQHLGESNEPINLAASRSLGHFTFDINSSKRQENDCVHSVDLSPVTPWIFHANHPFLFLITYGKQYLLIGQMLGPKISSKAIFSKDQERS